MSCCKLAHKAILPTTRYRKQSTKFCSTSSYVQATQCDASKFSAHFHAQGHTYMHNSVLMAVPLASPWVCLVGTVRSMQSHLVSQLFQWVTVVNATVVFAIAASLQKLPRLLHSVLRLLAYCCSKWEQVMKRPEGAGADGTSYLLLFGPCQSQARMLHAQVSSRAEKHCLYVAKVVADGQSARKAPIGCAP